MCDFSRKQISSVFTNSTVVSVGATVLALFLGVPAAYALSRGQFREKIKCFLHSCLSNDPAILFLIPYFTVYVKLQLIDTRIGLIIINLSFTLAMSHGPCERFSMTSDRVGRGGQD